MTGPGWARDAARAARDAKADQTEARRAALNIWSRLIVELLAAWAEDLGAPEPDLVAEKVFDYYRQLPISGDNTRSLITMLRDLARMTAAGGHL